LGTLVLLFFALTLVIFIIIHKKKRYQHLLEKQQMESNYQNQLLQSKLEVQEQSFK
jgi:two-component system NarL family sensor kinase